MLTIAEELLLLALDDEKGNIVFSAANSLGYGLAGAILSELTLEERITLEGKKVVITNDAPLEDKVLNRIASQIKDSAKSRSPRSWIERLNKTELRKELLQRLVEKGILQEKEEKVLGIFTRRRYPESQGAPEHSIRTRIQECLDGSREPDARTTMLLGLIKACNLVGEIVPKKEKRVVEKQIEQMMKNNPYSKAVKASVDAMQAAIIAACVAASASAASSSSGST